MAFQYSDCVLSCESNVVDVFGFGIKAVKDKDKFRIRLP